MYFAFVDDVKQSNPRRPDMGPLIGAGAILVSAESLRQLEARLNHLCDQFNFPIDDHKAAEFKWSP
jgi:hypothetical protein